MTIATRVEAIATRVELVSLKFHAIFWGHIFDHPEVSHPEVSARCRARRNLSEVEGRSMLPAPRPKLRGKSCRT